MILGRRFFRYQLRGNEEWAGDHEEHRKHKHTRAHTLTQNMQLRALKNLQLRAYRNAQDVWGLG